MPALVWAGATIFVKGGIPWVSEIPGQSRALVLTGILFVCAAVTYSQYSQTNSRHVARAVVSRSPFMATTWLLTAPMPRSSHKNS